MRRIRWVPVAVAAMVLLGGCRWVRVTAGPQPPANGVLTYDSVHGDVVLFAPSATPNASGPVRPGQTWTFDGASHEWVQRHPSTEPAVLGQIGFDGQSGTVVLVGSADNFVYNNCDTGTGVVAQTWTWDGTTWTQQHPAHAFSECWALGPSTMTYDPATQQLLFASGFCVGCGNQQANDWVWNTKTWRFVGQSPEEAAVAYDPSCHALVAFGGGIEPSEPPIFMSQADTRLWDGSRWRELLRGGGPAQPLARAGAGLTFDPALDAVIMFGGVYSAYNGRGPQPLHDTWAFAKCRRWIRLPTNNLPPVAAPGSNFVYDTKHHYALLFALRSTWLFN